MAIEVLTSVNPIVTTALACAWITKDESITINSMIWRDLTTAGGTLVLTNGGVTTTQSNVLIRRKYDATAVMTIKAISVITEPITVSRLYIHTNLAATNCAGGTLEIWKN